MLQIRFDLMMEDRLAVIAELGPVEMIDGVAELIVKQREMLAHILDAVLQTSYVRATQIERSAYTRSVDLESRLDAAGEREVERVEANAIVDVRNVRLDRAMFARLDEKLLELGARVEGNYFLEAVERKRVVDDGELKRRVVVERERSRADRLPAR